MHSNAQEWMEVIQKFSLEETRVGLEDCFEFTKICQHASANLSDEDKNKFTEFFSAVISKKTSREEGAAVTVRLFCSHTHTHVMIFLSLLYVRVLTYMFDHQVRGHKHKTSPNESMSPISLCDSSDMTDLSLSFASPAKESKNTPQKRKYRTRSNRSSAVAVTSTKITTVVPAAAKPVRKKKKTVKQKHSYPSHWIKGRGESGLKGVGYEPTTIKSRPWRAKFKTKQMRFATKAEAAEWFFAMSESEKQK